LAVAKVVEGFHRKAGNKVSLSFAVQLKIDQKLPFNRRVSIIPNLQFGLLGSEFLDKSYARTMRSEIEPMKKVAKMLRRHRYLLLNWFKANKQFSSGIVAGFNNKSKLTTKKADGFRTFKAAEIALY
jgi:transposase